METTRDRILQYIGDKRITKSQFYAKTGLSNGFLDKTLNPGSDKLDKILKAYPLLNLYWMVTGVGDMEVLLNSIQKTAPITSFQEVNERLDRLERLVALVDPVHIEQVVTKVATMVAGKVASLQTWVEKSERDYTDGKRKS